MLAQRNGVEPQRKALLGWWRPREVSGPTRLSHSRGSCHSAAEVSASRTDCITRRRGEGLGSDVDWRLKVFCPAFLQKSGRGPGAEPLGVSLCSQSAGGGQRGNPRRGFPLCGRPPPPAAPAICGRPQSSDAGRGWNPAPTGGWRNVARWAVDEHSGRRGRRPLRAAARPDCVPRSLTGEGRGVGNGENTATGGVFDFIFGTSGTPSPTGRLRRRGAGGHFAPGGGGTPPLRGAGGTGRGWWRV